MRRCLAAVTISTALIGCGSIHNGGGIDGSEQIVARAEAFIDAFYSFDASVLAAILDRAESSRPTILFYQGWAQGGNYKIMNRKPCMPTGADSIACPVTVDDDLINALGITFDVTDTFNLTFSHGEIVAVETSSDDPPEFHNAEMWVRTNRPELIAVPCQGFFASGQTPGACVKAMVQGFKEYATIGGAEKKNL